MILNYYPGSKVRPESVSRARDFKPLAEAESYAVFERCYCRAKSLEGSRNDDVQESRFWFAYQ